MSTTLINTSSSIESTTKSMGYPGLFASREEYRAYVSRFKALAHAKNLSAFDMLLHAILFGKDPKCGFTPITNSLKLANGAQATFAFMNAFHALQGTPTDRIGQTNALKAAVNRVARHPSSTYAAENLKDCENALKSPLPIATRYGCNPDDHKDCQNGLSMETFLKATK